MYSSFLITILFYFSTVVNGFKSSTFYKYSGNIVKLPSNIFEKSKYVSQNNNHQIALKYRMLTSKPLKDLLGLGKLLLRPTYILFSELRSG